MKIVILGLILLCSVSFAFAADHKAMKSSDKFAQLDKNKDGSISKDEANADAKLAKMFATLDLDKNALLSKKEFEAGGSYTDASQ